MKGNIRHIILKAIAVILLIPYVGIIFFPIWSAFFGFTFFFSRSYGIEALYDSAVVTLGFFWPIFMGSITYHIIYLMYEHKNSKKNKQ